MTERSISLTRNSTIRRLTEAPIGGLVNRLHKAVPSLTPNHINLFALLSVIGGAAIAASRNPKNPTANKIKTKVAIGLMTAGSLMDAFDGPLARLKDSENPGSVNFSVGQINDILSDRGQEVIAAFSRSYSAHRREDVFGTLAGLGAGITASWASSARAWSEFFRRPVPEGGKGILGLIGTRKGRVVEGITATAFPKVKGIPIQAILDGATTVGNISTALDRLRIANSQETPVLDFKVQKDARNRLIALGTFSLAALTGALLTYLIMNRKSEIKPKDLLAGNDYKDRLTDTEGFCNKMQLDHRFVGGAVTDWIEPQTRFDIDVASRRVTLHNPQESALIRSDGTIKDADLVCFTPDREKFKGAQGVFKKWDQKAERIGKSFPYTSMEAARHPDWPARKAWKQLVSAFEFDETGTPHLVYGKVDQAIKPESLEPWTIDLGDGTMITTFNPVAHRLCYSLRCPSGIKKKDQATAGIDPVTREGYSKISLLDNLATQTIQEGLRVGIDYRERYREWSKYIEKLSQRPDSLTRVKGKLTKLYWDTFGTDVAHGKGFWKKLSQRSNRVNGF